MTSPLPLLGRKAFTLAEVMVAAAIMIIAISLTLGVVTGVMRMNLSTQLKSDISADYRKMVYEFVDKGRASGGFRVFKSFSDRTPVGMGESGDFVVFYFYAAKDIKSDAGPSRQGISRVVGVYRKNARNAVGEMCAFDSARDPSWSGAPSADSPAYGALNTLLPSADYTGSRTLATLTLGGFVTGSGSTADLNAFMNLNNTSVLANGLIYRTASGGATTSDTRYQSTNSFNLTATPRS